MKRILNYLLITSVIFLLLTCGNKIKGDRFAGWDYEHMKSVKKDLKNENSVYYPAFRKLHSDAEKALSAVPFSVTFKNRVPPGGTKHDYMSMGPYWWPDTTKPDGLPYIRRDGIHNPDNGIDRSQLGDLFSATRTLALAWYFTGEKKYADKAVILLKTWFIDTATLMNPHLQYAQAIPGITTGRGIGIIDARGVYSLVDAVTLIEASGALREEYSRKIREWFEDFFVWLTTSSHGRDEDNYKNNHSVAYDVIVTGIARFLRNDEYVRKKISEMPGRRIAPMIKSDGRQPEELIRTNAFGYSVSNLRNFFDAGETGLKVGVNIFNYTNPEGGSLKAALDFLVKYIDKKDKWEWQQIGGWEGPENNLGLLVRRAARYFNDPFYDKIWKDKFSDKLKNETELLVLPGFN